MPPGTVLLRGLLAGDGGGDRGGVGGDTEGADPSGGAGGQEIGRAHV